jgi:hypothetical protein
MVLSSVGTLLLPPLVEGSREPLGEGTSSGTLLWVRAMGRGFRIWSLSLAPMILIDTSDKLCAEMASEPRPSKSLVRARGSVTRGGEECVGWLAVGWRWPGTRRRTPRDATEAHGRAPKAQVNEAVLKLHVPRSLTHDAKSMISD